MLFLYSGTGTILGHGNTGIGEGTHIVYHVEGGFCKGDAECGDKAAGTVDIQLEKLRLYMKQIRGSSRNFFDTVSSHILNVGIVQDNRHRIAGGRSDDSL